MMQQTIEVTQTFINTFEGQVTVAVVSGLILSGLGILYANRKAISEKFEERRRMKAYHRHLKATSGNSGFLTNKEIEENFEAIKVIVSTSSRGFEEANENVKNTFGKQLAMSTYNRIRMQMSKDRLQERFK